MQTSHRKIQRLPLRNVLVTRKDINTFRKRGYQHVRKLNSLEIKMCDHEFTREFFKSFGSKILRKFKYSLYNTSFEEIILLVTLFRKMNHRQLESFDLSVENDGMANDEKTKILAKSIRQLTNLKELNFAVYSFYIVEGLFLKPLRNSLRLLSKLENFKIRVELCDSFTNEGLKILSNSFNGLNPKTLTNLYIDLGRMRKDMQEVFIGLRTCIQKFSNLRSLYLNLSDNTVSSDALELFMNQLATVPSLERFGICDIDSPESHNALFSGLAKLTNLKSIHFKLYDVSKPNFIRLSESLSKLSSLEEIRLALTYPSPPSLFSFGFGIGRNNKPPRNPENEIDDKCLSVFCNALKNHSNRLQVFDLTLGRFGMGSIELESITSNGVLQIAELLASCNHLRELHMVLGNEIYNRVLESLSNSVQKMNNLKSLLLRFYGNENIYDDPFQLFLKTLSSSPTLKELSIYLDNFLSITDQSFTSLSQSLSQLNYLQLVNLKFNTFPNITSQSVKKAVNILKKSTTLEKANLSFVFQQETFDTKAKVFEDASLDNRFKAFEDMFSDPVRNKQSLLRF